MKTPRPYSTKTDEEILDLVRVAARDRVAVLLRTPGSTLDLERARAGKKIRGMETDNLAIMQREIVHEDRWEALADVCDAAYVDAARIAATVA